MRTFVLDPAFQSTTGSVLMSSVRSRRLSPNLDSNLPSLKNNQYPPFVRCLIPVSQKRLVSFFLSLSPPYCCLWRKSFQLFCRLELRTEVSVPANLQSLSGTEKGCAEWEGMEFVSLIGAECVKTKILSNPN